MRSLFTAAILTASVALLPFQAMAQAKPDAKTTTETQGAKAKKPVSAGQQAMRDRQKTCGAEWKTVKGTKAAEGKNWPKFWSECNKRLKTKQG